MRSQVLNHKLVGGKADLLIALYACVFWDPQAWKSQAEKFVSWGKAAQVSGLSPLTEPPGLRSYELGSSEAKKNILSSSLEVLVLFCPASRAGPFRGGSLTCLHLGLFKTGSQKDKPGDAPLRPLAKETLWWPWFRWQCCLVSHADPETSLPNTHFSEPG